MKAQNPTNEATNLKTSLSGDNAYDCEESMFKIDRRMVLSKLFYFFFFFGNGALLPYMALHFKQMLLTPTEVGVLMGLKPFLSFIVVPLWGVVVDRTRKAKLILTVSMAALSIFITLIACISAPDDAEKILALHCNKTDERSWSPWVAQRGVIEGSSSSTTNALLDNNRHPTTTTTTPSYFQYYYPKFYRYNGYPWPMDMSYAQSDSNNTSNENYTYDIDASATFIKILALLLVGTVIGCPSLAIVDTLTLRLLGDKSYKYGKQRLTGSLGWGLGAFIIGASLTATHKCILHRRLDLINYKPSFYTYGISLSLATFVCFWFRFEKDTHNESSKALSAKKITTTASTTTTTNDETASLLECWQVIRKPTYLYFLFTVLLMGFEMAFIKTYLFWHLKDMGACQILFSVISGINCIAEVSMFFFVDRLILVFGQKGVIYLSLGFYSARLFYYAVVPSPWWVLVVELLPGFTTAAAWAACLSYVNAQCTNYFKTTMQCILHSFHWGLGYGLGEVVGGVLVHRYGAPYSFFVNGIVCIITLVGYVAIEKYYTKKIPKGEEEKSSANSLLLLDNCCGNEDSKIALDSVVD